MCIKGEERKGWEERGEEKEEDTCYEVSMGLVCMCVCVSLSNSMGPERGDNEPPFLLYLCMRVFERAHRM